MTHKRWIIVPVTKEDLTKLEEGIEEINAVEWELTDEEFKVLWNDGVFDSINADIQETGNIVDDYEEAMIKDIHIIRELTNTGINTTTNEGKKLFEMFEKALNYNTGIYFCL